MNKEPLTGIAELSEAKRLLTIMDQGTAGTAMIAQLVKESNVDENAKPIIAAISASLEIMMRKKPVHINDKVGWSMAAILAAYELGKFANFVKTNNNSRPN